MKLVGRDLYSWLGRVFFKKRNHIPGICKISLCSSTCLPLEPGIQVPTLWRLILAVVDDGDLFPPCLTHTHPPLLFNVPVWKGQQL